ncbi:MAG: DNA adenine methylase [Myxococcota bacterium]|nr:DNA adenine methylase [Myxococcota bacterium]
MPATSFQLKLQSPLLPAKPFVKWVGGKRRVIPEILERMPSLFYNYYEPFIGGGALFFALRSMGAISDHHITISDTNLRLIRTYRAVRDDIDGLLGRLDEMQKKHCHGYYYAVRSWEIDKTKHDADVAAWFIYLNKTCFNGLYRVNKKNQFNSPMGRYKNPKICDIDNLRACHAHLQNVEILHSQFDYVYDKASLQDFVYFDPPYIPVSSTASFTAYTKDGFGLLQQSFLRDIARDLKDRGVHVMLSNSECPLIYDLYEDGFNIDVIQVGRAINSKASKRAAVGEVLIT